MSSVTHRFLRVSVFVFAATCVVAQTPQAQQSATRYRISFPAIEHHWMQVEATFSGLGQTPLQLRMSRSSPGRYALHDFAKNVYDVQAFGDDGKEMTITRPDAEGWDVASHPPNVTVKYKVFGDLVDGTYLAIDRTHAHINMPAAIMWARGLDDRPATLSFTVPDGVRWQIATQLHAGATALEFTAPNLQYLMDSPVEFGPVSTRQFAVDGRTFRVAVHHTGGESDIDEFSGDVEKIVKQEETIYGELPTYEPGSYTFIADYLPYSDEDGMEHRNSSILTSSTSIRSGRTQLLDTVAHEFFHSWNVERIRPRSLEPFDLERENMSAELWLAEGFTEYYGPLTLSRAGIAGLTSTADRMAGFINSLSVTPAAYRIRSAEDMSRMAVYSDGGRPIDRTNFSTTFISYYSFGGAIALGLDLTLRARSDGRVTLDDYMRAMWRVHGKPGGSREGYVDHPYTLADAEARLAEVSGDRAFARDFFARYIDGHEVIDYAPLLGRAGLAIRKQNGGAWLGSLRFDTRNGAFRLSAPTTFDSPAYTAGLDEGDDLKQLDGSRVSSMADVNAVLARHRPGDRIAVSFTDRGGTSRTTTVVLAEDPRIEIVPMASATAAQRDFRERWLGVSRTWESRIRN